MQTVKLITALALGASLAACATVPDIATRNAPFELALSANVPSAQPARALQPAIQQQAPMRVTDVKVNVPKSLTVSEANTYYPNAQIVWRGDPIGNRHMQVAQIFDTAARAGTVDLTGGTGVVLDVEVIRFHSVTERTRYSVGGVHNMMFNLTVRRASTGEALAPTRLIEANLPALAGRVAVEADRNGQTQKMRVTNFLSEAIRQELARFISA